MKERAHAELIKRWADGCEIQYRKDENQPWVDSPDPAWVADYEYRIKPAEPKRVYPETMMSDAALISTAFDSSKNHRGNSNEIVSLSAALSEAWDYEAGCHRAVANAALRHACDNGQVVTREEFDKLDAERKDAIESFSFTLKELHRAAGDRKARDLAVAQAAQEAAIRGFLEAPVGYRTRAIREADLAAIIAEVK